MPAPGHLQFDNIRFSRDGAAEMDRTRALVFIPAAEIVRIELIRGVGAENPAVTAFLAIVFLVIAVIPIPMLILALMGHGRFEAKFITAVAFVIPAWWLLELTFRRRWIARIHTKRSTRKLIFHSGDERQIRSFIDDVRSTYGYG